VPLTFDGAGLGTLCPAGRPVAAGAIETGRKKAASPSEDLLFTHRGLSGPAVLQISSYWRPARRSGSTWRPTSTCRTALARAKASSRKRWPTNWRLLVPAGWPIPGCSRTAWQRPVAEASDKALAQLAERLARWELVPTGTEGYKKAEVTLGGVDTRDLSSQTMESKQPGLYFIGEVVDVTGWLGGYNFQWAWASGHACAQALRRRLRPSA
jgi:predicted Rossmann fold flavoprotein